MKHIGFKHERESQQNSDKIHNSKIKIVFVMKQMSTS